MIDFSKCFGRQRLCAKWNICAYYTSCQKYYQFNRMAYKQGLREAVLKMNVQQAQQDGFKKELPRTLSATCDRPFVSFNIDLRYYNQIDN